MMRKMRAPRLNCEQGKPVSDGSARRSQVKTAAVYGTLTNVTINAKSVMTK